MGTIAEKLTYLNTTKSKIKDVINMSEAGITDDTFRSYPQKLYDGYINIIKDKFSVIDNMSKGTSTGSISEGLGLPVYEDKMSKLSTQDGTPSPSNPVEVKTVKGYRNLFDKSLTPFSLLNSTYQILDTGVRAICSKNESTSANNAVRYIALDITNYVGKTMTLSAHSKSSSTNKGFMYLRLCTSNGGTSNTYPSQITEETLDGDLSVSYTIPSDIGDYHYLIVALYSTRNSAANKNDYVDYTNLILAEGNTILPYIPYGINWVYTTISDGTNTKTTTIPLNNNEICGIGTNKDELTVDKLGDCYINKKIGKINSYNGETITTDYLSTTGGLDTGATIYYVLDTPSLIDLNYNVDLTLYEGTNTITNSENMDMEITYIKDTYE